MARISHSAALVIVALVSMLGLAGCVSIPTNSSPQPIGTPPNRIPAVDVPMPQPGMSPEALVRDFLKASVNPADRHRAARQYLTESARSSWDDSGATLILDQINVLTQTRTDDSFTARIVADKYGVLQPNGQLVAANGRVETTMTMGRVNGQWRIDGALQSGAIVDRTQFTASYIARDVYFPTPSGDRLVSDPRWVYGPAGDIASQLVRLLIGGPSADLANAVANALPTQATLRSQVSVKSTGGRSVDLGGVGGLGDTSRSLLAAQVIWTLSKADITGPYVLTSDDSPLDPRYGKGWTTSDVETLDPRSVEHPSSDLMVVSSGALARVNANGITPLSGPLGRSRTVIAADSSEDGTRIAAVSRGGPAGEVLQMGDLGGDVSDIASGRVITRPSISPDSNTVWAVVDGRVQRFRRDATGATQGPVTINADRVAGVARGDISEFQVSRDGVHVAAIISGTPIFAVISTAPNGEMSLTGVRVAAFNAGSQAASLDWISSDRIVLARSASDSPIMQVSIDGTPAESVLSSNLTPPVTAIVGDRTTLYAADSRGVLRLGVTNGEPDQYWSEVGSTIGSASIPILP